MGCRRARARAWIALLGACAGACDGGAPPSSSSDAGADAAPEGGGDLEVASPAPPAVPQLTPCPAGWREVADPDDPELVTCDPWPEGGRPRCGELEAFFPGEQGCVAIGPPCPEGDWPEGLPDDVTVRWVTPDAPTVGPCSFEAPCGSLERAMTVARDGEIIALSKGTFTAAAGVDKAVTVWGACVGQTRIAPLRAPMALWVSGAGATIRNVSVETDASALAVFDSPEPVTLEAIWIESSARVALSIENSVVHGRDLVIANTSASGFEGGFGVQVVFGSEAVLERVSVQAAEVLGVLVGEESSLTLRDAELVDVGWAPESRGIEVTPGSSAVLERTIVSGTHGMGVNLIDAALTASDLVIRSTSPDEDGASGSALVAFGSTVGLSRVVAEDGAMVALDLQDGSDLVASDLVVRDTREHPSTGYGGYGLQLIESTGHAQRVALSRNHGAGLEVEASDLALVDAAVTLNEPMESSGLGGVGLNAYRGAVVDLERVAFDRCADAALTVFDGARLTGRDVAIDDVRSNGAGRFGGGIQVVGASGELERVRVSGARGVAALVLQGELSLREVLVEGTVPWQCVETTCPERRTGVGMATLDEGVMDVHSFIVRGNALAGIQVAGGSIDLHMGEVRDNPIGANVQVDGFDLSRLQDDVRFIGNERSLDSRELPVPEFSNPLDPAL